LECRTTGVSRVNEGRHFRDFRGTFEKLPYVILLHFYTIRSRQVYIRINPSMKVIIMAPKAPTPRLLNPALGLSFCTKAVEVAAADEQVAVPKLRVSIALQGSTLTLRQCL
jgi:hypothetical protein